MERRSTWWAGNHGGEGMGGDFDVESQINFVLGGRSLSPATRRRCLLSVGQMSCKCHEKVGISS